MTLILFPFTFDVLGLGRSRVRAQRDAFSLVLCVFYNCEVEKGFITYVKTSVTYVKRFCILIDIFISSAKSYN